MVHGGYRRTRETLRVAAQIDPGKLRWVVPARLAIGFTLPLVAGQLAGQLSFGIAAALGALFAGVADTGEAAPVRARFMALTVVALALITTLAGFVSVSFGLILITSIPVALLCGYSAAFGPHSATGGVLTLVIFSIYAGAPVNDSGAVADGAAVLLGGAVQLLLGSLTWPLRRFGGVRTQVADAWREISVGLGGEPRRIFEPSSATGLVTAAVGVSHAGARGPSQAWLVGLLQSGEQLRLAFSAMCATREQAVRDGEPDPGAQLARAARRFARTVARAVVVPARARAIPARLAELREAAGAARAVLPARAHAVLRAATDAADLLAQPYPIGRRAELGKAVVDPWLPAQRARAQLRWSSPVARHAVRLAVVTPIAWMVGAVLLPTHGYWVPLTVAWLARPEYGLTVWRVVSRVAGTLIGLFLITGILLTWHPGTWEQIALMVIAAVLLYAALPVNYAVSVIFLTSMIIDLMHLDGESLVTEVPARAVATIMGGVLVLIAVRFGPVWACDQLGALLANLAESMRRYAKAVLTGGEEPRVAAQDVVTNRVAATDAVVAARLEPVRASLRPQTAEEVLDAMLTAIMALVAIEAADLDEKSGRPPVESVPRPDPQLLDADLAALQARLRPLSQPEPVPRSQSPTRPEQPGPAMPADPARAALHRAWGFLDAASAAA